MAPVRTRGSSAVYRIFPSPFVEICKERPRTKHQLRVCFYVVAGHPASQGPDSHGGTQTGMSWLDGVNSWTKCATHRFAVFLMRFEIDRPRTATENDGTEMKAVVVPDF
jgi:hypothetical protein